MERINQELLIRIMTKLNVRKTRVYTIINNKVSSTNLPRNLAAIAVANEIGINISKYVSTEDLAVMRQATIQTAPSSIILPARNEKVMVKPNTGRTFGKKRNEPRRGNTVFVVHGRDLDVRDSLFSFLRAVGLKPIEWVQVIKLTKKPNPYVGEILEVAFREAAAVVVLFTPDDVVKLKKQFVKENDLDHEKKLTGQARPNVLFEAGMAFGKDPNSTVLVQVGDVKVFSDIGGRHIVHLNDLPTSRQEFITKLANAGCNIDTSGTDWLSIGNFAPRKNNL